MNIEKLKSALRSVDDFLCQPWMAFATLCVILIGSCDYTDKRKLALELGDRDPAMNSCAAYGPNRERVRCFSRVAIRQKDIAVCDQIPQHQIDALVGKRPDESDKELCVAYYRAEEGSPGSSGLW